MGTLGSPVGIPTCTEIQMVSVLNPTSISKNSWKIKHVKYISIFYLWPWQQILHQHNQTEIPTLRDVIETLMVKYKVYDIVGMTWSLYLYTKHIWIISHSKCMAIMTILKTMHSTLIQFIKYFCMYDNELIMHHMQWLSIC